MPDAVAVSVTAAPLGGAAGVTVKSAVTSGGGAAASAARHASATQPSKRFTYALSAEATEGAALAATFDSSYGSPAT